MSVHLPSCPFTFPRVRSSSPAPSDMCPQVFRALRPPLMADVCSTLLMCLHQCFAAAAVSGNPAASGGDNADRPTGGGAGSACPAPSVCMDVAIDLIVTLRTLIEDLESPGRLVLYPQVCNRM